MAAHFHPTAFKQHMNTFDRKAIEAQIENLIALLDALDGDWDLEAEEDACLAGDDGCGLFVFNGRRYWGSGEDAPLATLPIYGIDQTTGPLNEAEACRAHQLALCGVRV